MIGENDHFKTQCFKITQKVTFEVLILAFSTNFCFIKNDLSGSAVWPQASAFEKLAKLTIFGIFNKLLSTQNVNVARFARNVECDFFCDFQTLCSEGDIRDVLLFLLLFQFLQEFFPFEFELKNVRNWRNLWNSVTFAFLSFALPSIFTLRLFTLYRVIQQVITQCSKILIFVQKFKI